MKMLHGKFLGFAFLAFMFFANSQSFAQATSFAGNWESTAPIVSMNNSVLRIKILSTSDPAVFIIINAANPKKKITAKYDSMTGRLHATVRNIPLYFVYISSTDSLECNKTVNDARICDLNRY